MTCPKGPHHKGDRMPRLSSKMTLKIDPELLRRIQSEADERSISVSNYVRKALIHYIREMEEEMSPTSLRISLTLMETHVLSQLLRIGAISEPQDMFHKAFDAYLSNDLQKLISFADRLKDMREFSPAVPLTTRKTGVDELSLLDEEEDLEGEMDQDEVPEKGSG